VTFLRINVILCDRSNRLTLDLPACQGDIPLFIYELSVCSQILAWWRAPQQMLRTLRHLVQALWWRWAVSLPSFTINGAPVEWNWQEKTDNSEKNLSQCQFVHQKISHGLTRDRTRGSAVGGRRLTAWAMARPYVAFRKNCYLFRMLLTAYLWNNTIFLALIIYLISSSYYYTKCHA
jgi:hypothetical protein